MPAVLYHHHDAMGHPGGTRTYKTIRLHYFWPTLVVDCKKYAQMCRHCELRKANNHQARIPIQAYPAPAYPWHTVHIDATGPFPGADGFKYILVAKDKITKWVELAATTDKSASTISSHLVRIFLRHGPPAVLISDRGGEFSNRLLTQILRLLETQQIRITPQNPRSNGLAENQMRTLKDMLSALVDRVHGDWHRHLESVMHIYNTTVNMATGYTPYYLMYGRECHSPDESHLRTNIENLDKYVINLRDSLLIAWDSICGNAWTDKTIKYNQVPKKRLPFVEYVKDQLFYLKKIPRRFYRDLVEEENYQLSSKLQERFTGPFRIVERLTPVTYRAQIHGSTKTVHAINMKPARVALNVADHLPEDSDEEDSDSDHEDPQDDAEPELDESDDDLPPPLDDASVPAPLANRVNAAIRSSTRNSHIGLPTGSSSEDVIAASGMVHKRERLFYQDDTVTVNQVMNPTFGTYYERLESHIGHPVALIQLHCRDLPSTTLVRALVARRVAIARQHELDLATAAEWNFQDNLQRNAE